MATPFNKTIRSLDREPKRLTSITLMVFLGLLLAWALAAALVPVPVRLSTTDARLISAGKPIALHSRSGMPVEAVLVDIGDGVRRGELLVRFDSAELRVELAAALAQVEALEGQLGAIRQEQSSLKELASEHRKRLVSERTRVRARLAKMNSGLAWAETEHRRLTAMGAGGAISRRELQRSANEVEKASASVAEERAALASMNAAIGAQRAEYDKEYARLDGLAGELRADIAERQGRREALQEQLARTELRAPVNASVGAMAILGVGTTVAETDWVLTLVPDAGYEVEARFDSGALGQLRLGQAAWLRLDAFPWANYGVVPTKLVRLSNERQGDFMMARFQIGNDIPEGIPLQHGLEGELEVEVRRVPIAELLLEAIGRFRSS